VTADARGVSRSVLTLAIVVVAAAVCARLGVWQLHRLDDRRQRNAKIAAHLAQEEFALTAAVLGDSSAYRRVWVSGVWDFERQVIVVGRPMMGIPGVHVVTPLRLDEQNAILVERGWMPSPDARAIDLTPLVEGDRATVHGVLLPPVGGPAIPGDEWPVFVPGVTPGSLAGRFPYNLMPLVLRRTAAVEGLPPLMRLVPLPELTNGPHLSYALQWFAFALIAIVGGIALSRRQSNAPGWRGTGRSLSIDNR